MQEESEQVVLLGWNLHDINKKKNIYIPGNILGIVWNK